MPRSKSINPILSHAEVTLENYDPPEPMRHSASVWLGFAAIALGVYWPSMNGLFFSDDVMYLVGNDYIHELSAANLWAILDPWGAPDKMILNYAPVHLLLHSVEWSLFGPWHAGYHLVNIALHWVASLLLVQLFQRSGIPKLFAIAGGVFFLVHPANVEAVAWISQLKSTAGLVFALAALTLLRAHPGGSFVLFVLALLTKALTAFALPVAILFEWARRRGESPEPGDARARNLALFAWGVALVIYVAVEFPVFRYTNASVLPMADDSLGIARGMIAIAGRYLVMASSGFGVSAFQEAPEIDSWMAPWFLIALPLLCVLTLRLVISLRHRDDEAVYWVWALISFGPVSQLFAFLHPVADRYLYFILPGLIGGCLMLAARFAPLLGSNLKLARGVALAVVLILAGFALQAHERARLWGSPTLVDADAIKHYPEGLVARLYRSRDAASRGDVDAVVEDLNFVVARGVFDFYNYQRDPVWNPVRRDPRFREVLERMARRYVALEPLYLYPSQVELRGLAHARILLGEFDEAEVLLLRALEQVGLRDDQIRRELVSVRLKREKAAEATAPSKPRASSPQS